MLRLVKAGALHAAVDARGGRRPSRKLILTHARSGRRTSPGLLVHQLAQPLEGWFLLLLDVEL